MKKIVFVITLLISVLVLSACNDKKYFNEDVTVSFFLFNEAGGLIPSIGGLEPGQLIPKPDDPVRPGFDFDGWSSTIDGNNVWNFDVNTVGDQSFVLFARWIPAIAEIIYDLNGGEFPANVTVPLTFNSGERIVLPQPILIGSEFLGWFLYDWVDETSTRPGDRGLTSIPANQVGDLVIYAHWKAIVVNVAFRTNFPIEGGPSNPASRSVAYGSVIDFPDFDDTLGYRFLGWNQRSDGTGIWFVNGQVFERTNRITVYAIWEKI